MGELIALVLLIITIILIIYVFRLKKKNITLDELAKKSTKERDLAIEKEKVVAKDLEQKKIENLRFALNPHSFRNTLNTIEHLAKSTLDSVNSLSGIFDYMLYDAKNQFVSLEQEINFAQEYLKLYRLRLKPIVNVRVSIDDNLLNGWSANKTIAPLIFAHFIENAFKHGDLESDDAFIYINIETLNENELIYSVRNKIAPKKSNLKGGIGNSSFSERLKLLYKNSHALDYKNENDEFTANMKITLNNE